MTYFPVVLVAFFCVSAIFLEFAMFEVVCETF